MKVLTTVEAELQELNDPQVRDLGWACFSQALCVLERRKGSSESDSDAQPRESAVPHSLFAASHERLSRLRALDKQPDALHEHLAARHGRRRLGIYFEHLVEFFILNDPSLEFAARNVAVRSGAHTLGEFDVLYYDRSTGEPECLIHLEIAVKFYLGLPEALRGGFAHCWRGPGSHDAFEMKLNKMITQQSRLAEQKEAKRALSELGLKQPGVERVAIAGELFQPHSRAVPTPIECLEEHHSAHWIYLDDASVLFREFSRAAVLDKAQWLTPVPADYLSLRGVSPERALEQVHKHFARSDFPLMVELAKGSNSERVFVVPASWPAAGIKEGKRKRL